MSDKFYTFCDRFGGNILHRFVNKSGSKRIEKVSHFPISLYEVDRFGEHTGLGDIPLKEYCFESIDSLKKFHFNKKPWGQQHLHLQFLSEEYPGEVKFDPSKITICYIDIETYVGDSFPHPALAQQPITAITMKFSDRDISVSLGCKSLDSPIPGNRYIQCRDEQELLQKFLIEWRDAEIDIVSSWNGDSFDIPYIVNRLKNVLGDNAPNTLSPFNKMFKNGLIREKKLKGDDIGYDILGITSYDYMDLYKKFNMGTPESYSLNYITGLELGEGKIDYSEEGSLNDLYENNFQKYLEYNIKDTLLVEKLEGKLKFINIALTMAYMTKARLSDVHSSIRLWDAFLYNKLKSAGIQVPPDESHSEVQIVGGYVKEPLKGLHKWVVSFDLASLYPSIIIQHNLSPETLVKEASGNYIHEFIDKVCLGEPSPKSDTTMLANGAEFRKDKRGFLPQVSSEMFDLRKKYKSEMLRKKQELEGCSDLKVCKQLEGDITSLDAMQFAVKTLMNALN